MKTLPFRPANSLHAQRPRGLPWKAAPLFFGALLLALGLPARAQSHFELGPAKGGGATAEYAWDGANKVLTIQNGANITITGRAMDGTRIEVAADAAATITFINVTIAPGGTGGKQSPLRLNAGAKVALKILATNVLTAGNCADAATPEYCAGIVVPKEAALSINDAGAGDLTVTGGNFGAGIGGGGAITINGGMVTVNGVKDGVDGKLAIHGGVVAVNGVRLQRTPEPAR